MLVGDTILQALILHSSLLITEGDQEFKTGQLCPCNQIFIIKGNVIKTNKRVNSQSQLYYTYQYLQERNQPGQRRQHSPQQHPA